jgi:predicted metal-dependent hydrolase
VLATLTSCDEQKLCRQDAASKTGRIAMATKETIVAKLAEWGLTLTEREIDQLVPAYENLLRWHGVLEGMMQSKKLVEGMTAPASEPILTHAIERKG